MGVSELKLAKEVDVSSPSATVASPRRSRHMPLRRS